MDNQANQLDNSESDLENITTEETASRGQSIALQAISGVVFYKFNCPTGRLFNLDVSGSLGVVMERVKARYQEFLPKSWLRRFISKVVIERGTVDHLSTYDPEAQGLPVQVGASTEDDHLTEAFRNPQQFFGVSAQNAGFDVLSSSTSVAPFSHQVVSFKTILNERRLFWMLVTAMFGILLVAGSITALVSKSVQTVGAVIGVVIGLFCLLVTTATWLWRFD